MEIWWLVIFRDSLVYQVTFDQSEEPDGGEVGEGRRWIFRNKFRFLDEVYINFRHLNPLSKLVDLGRESVCVPLEDAEG